MPIKRTLRTALQLVVAMIIMGLSGAGKADEISILMATVTHDGRIRTDDGQTYHLAPGPTAVELGRHQGKTVIVTGFVEQQPDKLSFSVTAFQVVPEKSAGDGQSEAD